MANGNDAKPWYASFTQWGAIVTVLLGMLTSATDAQWAKELASYVQTNQEQITGMVMQAIGLYMLWARLRAKQTLKV